MEYTAMLAGERFNDHPRCTHPAMAELARQVNDRVTGNARPSLITRAPSLAALGPHHAGVAAAVADAQSGPSDPQSGLPTPQQPGAAETQSGSLTLYRFALDGFEFGAYSIAQGFKPAS